MRLRENVLVKLSFSLVCLVACFGLPAGNAGATSTTSTDVNAFICAKTEISMDNVTTNDDHYSLPIKLKTGGGRLTVYQDDKKVLDRDLTVNDELTVDLVNLHVGENRLKAVVTGDCSDESEIVKSATVTVSPLSLVQVPNTGYVKIGGTYISIANLLIAIGSVALIATILCVHIIRRQKNKVIK